MVLTDRQRTDLHAGIYEYLISRPEEAFQVAAEALLEADPEACKKFSEKNNNNNKNGNSVLKTPLLEKKWTAIPRLQKKVLELERQAAQSAKIHAHRTHQNQGSISDDPSVESSGSIGQRRMLPRLPATHTLQGHANVVTCCALHPVFTVVVSGSEDGTVKVRRQRFEKCHLTNDVHHMRAKQQSSTFEC
jgi:platelet-activating factor acetylhydrolase IB subunit alpha